jgi:muramidase (phage lysozyme)
LGNLFLSTCFAAITALSLWEMYEFRMGEFIDPAWNFTPTPLVMRGGDPYIRALMRTISASEANSTRPYSLLYGGEHIQDFSRHPDICIPIATGPNIGDCTTAAGRYQFLTTTWLDKASQYHPDRFRLFFWEPYSFAPEFQDKVTHDWLSDPQEWAVDIPQMLRDGQLEAVLQLLSPTWTSLSYGIEPNTMTASLPIIYEQMLQEELKGVVRP